MSLENQSLSCISSQIFMAPELLKEDMNYTEKVDVYSFGVLLYFILSGGELPNINLIEILTGKKAKLPENFNNNAKELIYECWSFNPQNRPNFKDILNWIKLKNYCLVDLSQPEIDQIKKDINDFKISIPLY